LPQAVPFIDQVYEGAPLTSENVLHLLKIVRQTADLEKIQRVCAVQIKTADLVLFNGLHGGALLLPLLIVAAYYPTLRANCMKPLVIGHIVPEAHAPMALDIEGGS
jgi:hypothetical protein